MALKCPDCGGPAFKAIYMGLPFYMCEAEEACGTGWGAGSWLAALYFDGRLMRYEGSYLRALWVWLTR